LSTAGGCREMKVSSAHRRLPNLVDDDSHSKSEMSKHENKKPKGCDLQPQSTQHGLLPQVGHVPSAGLQPSCSSLDEEGEDIGGEEDFDEPGAADEEAATGDFFAEGEGKVGEEDVVGGEEEAGLWGGRSAGERF